MFIPELKNTEWAIPEAVFEITGENYQESNMLYRKYHEVERKDGSTLMLSEPIFHYNIDEKKIATAINDSLMYIVWESITISELENHFKEAISNLEFNIVNFRLTLDGDFIFGWFHYKKYKKIETFRFKIDLKGGFSKC